MFNMFLTLVTLKSSIYYMFYVQIDKIEALCVVCAKKFGVSGVEEVKGRYDMPGNGLIHSSYSS